jgi:Tfp pilus assembly PilM family ATPase
MTQLFILNWERRRICGIEAASEGTSVRIDRSFTHDWPSEFDPLQSPDQAAVQLQKAWSHHGTGVPRVIVCLSREDVILRHLDLPDVAEDELPDLVRFQAAARSTVPLDQLLLDFLPMPRQPGREGRPVLAITVAKGFVQTVQKILRDAGLEPAVITFSSIGLAEFAAHLDRQNGERFRQTALLIHKDGERVELVIESENRLLYAHAARTTGDEATTVSGLLAEVSRTIVAAERLHPKLKIHHAYLVGDDLQGVASSLSERLTAPVESIDSRQALSAKMSPGDFPTGATPLLSGLALAEVDRLTLPCDFLHPRRPPAKINRRKLQVAVGAAAALLVASLVTGGVEGTRASLQRQIDALDQEEKDLDFKITPGLAVLNAARLIDQWQAGDRNQLQQLSDLEDLLEGTDRIYLSQYAYTVGQGEILGNLQAFGNAKSREDVVQFQERLTDTKTYRIQPRQLTQSGSDDEYPHRFELHADLLFAPKAPLNPQPHSPNP